jgi:hypothetical protein
MSIVVLIGAAAAVAASGAPAASATPSVGVVSYPASYFAEMRPNTAMDMIQRLPGFAFDSGAQVRGFAGAAGNVLIDGQRPTSKQDDLGSILQRIPAAQVDHIDLIRGGAPGIDMQGRTVLANVVRKSGGGLTGVAAVATEVWGDGRVTPTARVEIRSRSNGQPTEASLVGGMFGDDGEGSGGRVRVDPDGNVLVRSHVDGRGGGFLINATAAHERPLWGGTFRINALAHLQNYKQNEDDHLITPVGLELLRFRQDSSNGEIGMHFEKALTPKLQFEALAIQKYNRQHIPSHFMAEGEDDLFASTSTSGESIVRSTLRYTKSPKLSFELAAEGDYNIQKTDSSYFYNGAPVDLPAAHVTVSEKRGEIAGTATWKASSKFTLEAGLRTEASQIASTGDVVLSKVLAYPKPRVLATFSPDADNQIRLRAEREVSQLDFGSFVASSNLGTGSGSVQAGNPNLEPQSDWVLEGTYERHFKGVVGVLTYRHLFIQNAIDRIPIYSSSGVFDAPGNIGSASEDDIEGNLTLPLDKLGLKGAQLKAQGTWRHTRVMDPTTGVLRPFTQTHRFDYEAHYTQDIKRLRSTWGIDVFGRNTQPYYRFSEIDYFKIKAWVEVYFEYKPKPDLSLRFELDNATGRGFERLLYVYNGPRGASGLAYIDDRRQQIPQYVHIRLRKTFG